MSTLADRAVISATGNNYAAIASFLPGSLRGMPWRRRQAETKLGGRNRPATIHRVRETTRRSGTRYWSGRVTRESNALDLEAGVFSLNDPKLIAASLKRSAERSRRRKAAPYRSALSMLVFYINRAGKKLSVSRRRTLERAKIELRRQFGRDQA